MGQTPAPRAEDNGASYRSVDPEIQEAPGADAETEKEQTKGCACRHRGSLPPTACCSPVIQWVERFISLRHTAQGYAELHTDTAVCFMVRLTAESAEWNNDEIEQRFKLAKYIALGNMHLYDANGCIKHYNNSLAVLQEFYKIRRKWYKKRRVR